MKKLVSAVLVILMILSFCACGKSENTEKTESGLWNDAFVTEDKEYGQGEKTITLKVVAEDKSVVLTVRTDADFLGRALLDNEIIDGDMGEYGMYIKYVNGMRADYDLDGAYWALTKNGEMLSTGADQVEISDGESYEFTYTK